MYLGKYTIHGSYGYLEKKTVALDSVDRGSLELFEGIDHVLRCVRLKFHKNLRGQIFEEMRLSMIP